MDSAIQQFEREWPGQTATLISHTTLHSVVRIVLDNLHLSLILEMVDLTKWSVYSNF